MDEIFENKILNDLYDTSLIDEDGAIVKAFGKVKPKDNPKQMLKELN